MTCKWLITMVIVSPLTGVIPLPNGHSWLMLFAEVALTLHIFIYIQIISWATLGCVL